jgi:hypothetical protein
MIPVSVSRGLKRKYFPEPVAGLPLIGPSEVMPYYYDTLGFVRRTFQ